MRLRELCGVAGLIADFAASAMSAFAQDSTPQHTADIWAGNCSSLDEAVVPLAPVVIPEGDVQGEAGAAPVAQSVREAPLPLMDLLSASYAVAVQASFEQIGTPIACGEIGGALSEDGSLTVGLEAMNGAKVSGVASFAPTAAGLPQRLPQEGSWLVLTTHQQQIAHDLIPRQPLSRDVEGDGRLIGIARGTQDHRRASAGGIQHNLEGIAGIAPHQTTRGAHSSRASFGRLRLTCIRNTPARGRWVMGERAISTN